MWSVCFILPKCNIFINIPAVFWKALASVQTCISPEAALLQFPCVSLRRSGSSGDSQVLHLVLFFISFSSNFLLFSNADASWPSGTLGRKFVSLLLGFFLDSAVLVVYEICFMSNLIDDVQHDWCALYYLIELWPVSFWLTYNLTRISLFLPCPQLTIHRHI